MTSVNDLNHENLSSMDIEEYIKKNKRPTVILPLGSLEQHEHIAMGIDTILARRVAEEISKKFGFLIAPALPIGHSPEHVAPGVVWFKADTYLKVLGDVVDSYLESGFKRIIFLNAHVGNKGLVNAMALLYRRYAGDYDIAHIEVWDYIGKCFNTKNFKDFCIAENSLALYFDIIKKEEAVKKFGEREFPSSKISPIVPWLTTEINGALISTVKDATKDVGRKIFECVVRRINEDISNWLGSVNK